MQPTSTPTRQATSRPVVRELTDIVDQSQQALDPLLGSINDQEAAFRQQGQALLAGEEGNLNRVFGQIGQEAIDRGGKYSGLAPELKSKYTADVYAPKRLEILAQTESRVADLNRQRADYRFQTFRQAQELQEADINRQFQYDAGERQFEQQSTIQTAQQAFESQQQDDQQTFLTEQNQADRQFQIQRDEFTQTFQSQQAALDRTFQTQQNDLNRQLEISEGDKARQLQTQLAELQRQHQARTTQLELDSRLQLTQLENANRLRVQQIASAASARRDFNNQSIRYGAYQLDETQNAALTKSLFQLRSRVGQDGYVSPQVYNQEYAKATSHGVPAELFALQSTPLINPRHPYDYAGQSGGGDTSILDFLEN